MAGLTRDRGCLYYVPWIAIISLAIFGGAIGVWIHFLNQTYNSTNDGLKWLGVDAVNLERPRPAMIASSVIFFLTLAMVALLSLVRSFIEAAHDATGLSGAGSTVWLVLNALFAIPWWLLVIWMVLLIEGCTLWAGLLYVLKGSIRKLLDTYGPTQPAVTWLPSDNKPCPGECLNLTYFTFLDASLADSCICDYAKLAGAEGDFNDGFKSSAAMVVGIWVMFAASFVLLVNFACAFAHTRREKEYIRRLTHKQFIGF